MREHHFGLMPRPRHTNGGAETSIAHLQQANAFIRLLQLRGLHRGRNRFRAIFNISLGKPSAAITASEIPKSFAIWAIGASFLRAIAGNVRCELFRISTRHNTHPSSSVKRYRLMSTKLGALPKDKVGKNGKVTLSRAGRWHDIGLGAEHAGTKIKMLINDLDVTVINTETGEILRELTINPDTDCQSRGIKPGHQETTGK